jgi:hypothetical protein
MLVVINAVPTWRQRGNRHGHGVARTEDVAVVGVRFGNVTFLVLEREVEVLVPPLTARPGCDTTDVEIRVSSHQVERNHVSTARGVRAELACEPAFEAGLAMPVGPVAVHVVRPEKSKSFYASLSQSRVRDVEQDRV